jgi:hypothetical protein
VPVDEHNWTAVACRFSLWSTTMRTANLHFRWTPCIPNAVGEANQVCRCADQDRRHRHRRVLFSPFDGAPSSDVTLREGLAIHDQVHRMDSGEPERTGRTSRPIRPRREAARNACSAPFRIASSRNWPRPASMRSRPPTATSARSICRPTMRASPGRRRSKRARSWPAELAGLEPAANRLWAQVNHQRTWPAGPRSHR